MRFAIAGCGKVGRRHAEQYRRIAGAQVVGCYDADPAVSAAVAKDLGLVSIDRLESLLDLSADGLSICTPPASHIPIAAAAVERGVRVLCEKPLATSLDDCRTLRDHTRFACAFKFRHLRGAGPLRAMIARGDLGRILSVRGTAISDFDMSGRWFSDPVLAGGGVLIDNGVHLIDLCRYLLGPVAEVSASVSGGTRGLSVEETASVYLRMSCGAAAHLLMSWEAPAPMPPLIEIHGSSGYARLGNELEVFDATGRERVLHLPADGVDIWHEVVANFARFVADASEPSARFEDGWHALAAVDAAYRSLRSGRWETPARIEELR